jgi:plastocyanin
MTTTNQGVGGSSNGTAATGRGASGSANSGTGDQNVFVMGEFFIILGSMILAVSSIVLMFILSILFNYKAVNLTHYKILKIQSDIHNNTMISIPAPELSPHKIIISIVPDAAYLGNKAFSPNPVIIKTGDTITWIDNDVETHTVTSGFSFNDHNKGKLFDSDILNYAQVFSHTFNNPGEFNYFCQFHPTMTGKVIVK